MTEEMHKFYEDPAVSWNNAERHKIQRGEEIPGDILAVSKRGIA